ncbi:CBS domain-containing protein [Desertivirga xinjiangensis]|uniref:CBS domain-containing protein n=1 Tax=Desertivirga xinjiangensis TaxID=539206 RepID=UPI00210F1B39|nr:CBS domain-containing protein [Pedobacter xinjiangensis]
MIARELISDVIPPLSTQDSIQKVLDRMAEFRVDHMPVVENKQLLGLLSEDDLIEVQDYSTAIEANKISLNNTCIYQEQHIYDVIRVFGEKHLSLIPVLDENSNYLGVISVNTMVEFVASITAVKEPGGIIVLEIGNRNNSLAHISQVVESNNAQILSSYIRSFADSTRLEITLKINRYDLSAIIASFIRYDYTVLSTYNDLKAENSKGDRYDQLINYLNI